MNRGLISSMVALLAGASFGRKNAIEIKPAADPATINLPIAKLAGMSPRDIARYRKSCGRPKRKANKHHYARLAKVRRRRA
jgi:hypothetical protein